MPLSSKTRPPAEVDQLDLVFRPRQEATTSKAGLLREIVDFTEFGKATSRLETTCAGADGRERAVATFVNEFWTSKQRQANSLHEISYRACFKPQLPRFFIERLTLPGERVYDPFMGRGTTLLEAALLGRVPVGCDVNPLSAMLVRPRLRPPTLKEVETRLKEIELPSGDSHPEDLLVFYHPKTLAALCALKEYFGRRETEGSIDNIDEWVRMVAINRLTGHSPGFFSVYTLPPNQAVSVQSQRRINEKRSQTPPERDVKKIILRKSRILLRDSTDSCRAALASVSGSAQLLTGKSAHTPQIADNSVALAVTSPPFLNVVDYATDNWLRCWFAGIDAKTVKLTVPRSIENWQEAMTAVFLELHRVLRPGGHVAFEVGEVHAGKTKLEEAVLPCGLAAGLDPLMIVINDQEFTKTANCWGVDNMAKGTNTNRIVIFVKP